MAGLSIAWALVVRFKPKWIGFDGPASPKAYLVCLLLMSMPIFFIIKDRNGLFRYPDGFDMYNNMLFVTGPEEFTETSESDTQVKVQRSVVYMYDKSGNRVGRYMANACYIEQNKMFLGGAAGYWIADLKTGELLDAPTEDDILEQASKFASEKIFSCEFDGSATFLVRTVKDKTFNYNPLSNNTNTASGYSVFAGKRVNPFAYTGQTDLFQPEVVGQAADGTLILMGYDDLERKAFTIAAVTSDGQARWSKRDAEISMSGWKFSDSHCQANTIVDDQNVYFVTQRFLVCISLATGELKWISEF